MSPRLLRLLAPLALIALAGCNTVSGLGQDVEAGGEAIQEGSEEVEQELDD
mgnify:CR=1 FL=1